MEATPASVAPGIVAVGIQAYPLSALWGAISEAASTGTPRPGLSGLAAASQGLACLGGEGAATALPVTACSLCGSPSWWACMTVWGSDPFSSQWQALLIMCFLNALQLNMVFPQCLHFGIPSTECKCCWYPLEASASSRTYTLCLEALC